MAKRSRDETDVRRGHVGVGWNADRDGYGPSYFGRKYPKTPTTRHEMQLFQKMTKWTSAVVDTTRFSRTVTNCVSSITDLQHVLLVCDLLDNHHLCKNGRMAPEFMSAGLETCRLGDFKCLSVCSTRETFSLKDANDVNVCWLQTC